MSFYDQMEVARKEAALNKHNKERLEKLEQTVDSHSGILKDQSSKMSAIQFHQLNEGCASLATLNKEVAKKVAQPEVWSECAALCKKIGELEYCEFYQQD